MALKPILDSLDGVADTLQSEYQPGTGALEGKFVLDVTPHDGFELTNTAGLKSALQKERQNVASFKTKYSGIDDLLENADAARDALTRVAEFEKNGGNKEELDTLKEQLRVQSERDADKLKAKFSKELNDSADQLSVMDQQLRSVLLQDRAQAEIAKAGGNAKLLAPVIMSLLRANKNDKGQYGVEVIDQANPDMSRLSPQSGSTQPMTIAELVQELKGQEEFAVCFPAEDKSGMGSRSSNGGNGQQGSKYIISPETAKNPVKYRAAREHASKNGLQLTIE